MNRLDLTLRSTIHIQYANALAFDFFFFGSFFFTAVERKDTYRPLFSLRSKVFCMISIRGTSPPIPPKNANNEICQRGQTSTVRGLAVTGAGVPLGIITKSHPIHTVQGFQRIRDFFFYGTMRHCLGFGGVLDYTHSNIIKIDQKMIIP